MLSEKQKTFFENLKKNYGKEPLPSYEIIAKDFGFKHKNSVWQYFNKLKENDLIREKNGKFFINPDCFGAIMFTSSVRAGFATVAEDSIEKRISFDEVFDLDNPSVFVFNVSGDSMVNAGIFDGDTAIIRRANRADNGQIVVALVDDEEATLKILDKKQGNEVWLLPCNKDYEPIKLTADRLKIQGVLYGIVRKYN